MGNQKNEQEVEPDCQVSKPALVIYLLQQSPPSKDSTVCHKDAISRDRVEGLFPSNPLKNVHPHCQDLYLRDCIFLYFTTLKNCSIFKFSQFVFHVKNQKLPSGEMSFAPPPHLPNLLALQLCSCAEKAAVLFLEPRCVKVSSGSLSGRLDAWVGRAASLPSDLKLFQADSCWELAGEKL